MIYVALAAIAVTALTILAFAGVLRSITRQHAREREQLLARMMHLADKTWEPPPSRPALTFPEQPSYHFGDDAPVGS